MKDIERNEARAQSSMSQGSFSVTNKLADLSTGVKFASLCTVSLTLGLLIPFTFARRRSRNFVTDVAPMMSTAHSPTTLLRARNPSIKLSQPQPYGPSKPMPSFSSSTEATGKASLFAVKDAVKALFISTALVGTVASASYYGFRQATGIRTAEEFSQFMRSNISEVVPSSYQVRLASSADESHIPHVYEAMRPSGDPSIDAAEERLRDAYQEGGVVRWGEQAWKELEGEWEENNRSRR